MAEGDIGAVIDNLVYYTGTMNMSSIVHVAGNVYAVAFSDDGDAGVIRTFEITPAGEIGAAVIDTFTFDSTKCLYPNLIHVTGQVFAVVYNGPLSDGFVATVEISAAGEISDPVLDKFEFDIANIEHPHIIRVSVAVYAIVYSNAASHGMIRTISISEAGIIGDPVLDSFEFNAVVAYNPRILHVGGNYYAIAYGGNPHPGMITTITISSGGDIGPAVIDTGSYSTVLSRNNIFIHIFENVYAVVYRGGDYDGFLTTVTISAAGVIAASPIETWEYDITEGRNPFIYHISGDVYAILHDGSGTRKHLLTFHVSNAGDINPTIIDEFIFPGADSSYFDMLHISGSIYAFSFRNNTNDGEVLTLDLETVLPSSCKYMLLLGVG